MRGVNWSGLMICLLLELAGAGYGQSNAVEKTGPGGLPERLTIDLGKAVTMEFVLIRPGSFLMGSETGETDEKPAHKVTISKPFYLGKFEVTQQQWQALLLPNSSEHKCVTNPVDTVTWDDCQTFLARLREKVPGRPFSLPSEAQWEYACRAGRKGNYSFDETENRLAEFAWYDKTTSVPRPVGQLKPNAWGLYDMHGNVAEWCQDLYHDSYQGAPADGNAWIQGGASNRVLRGGSWVNNESVLRSSYRDQAAPDNVPYNHNQGLRVALPATTP